MSHSTAWADVLVVRHWQRFEKGEELHHKRPQVLVELLRVTLTRDITSNTEDRMDDTTKWKIEVKESWK